MAGRSISSSIKIFESFSNVNFENLSRWGKSLFTDICLPVTNDIPRKDLFTLMFFNSASFYLNSERPLEKLTKAYPAVSQVSDPNNKIFLSSFFTSENIELENSFLIRWFKFGSRPTVNEPDSFLSPRSSLDRYLIFYYKDESDLKPSFNIIYGKFGIYNTVDINPGYLYVCNMIVRLDTIEKNTSKFTIYPSNFPEDVNGKLALYDKNTFDYKNNYNNSNIYVFRDNSSLTDKRYFICVHPLLMNGVLFKRLTLDTTMLDFDNVYKEAYEERNDFLAGVNISTELTGGVSNRFVISLIHVPFYQKLNPLIYGSIAVLGCVRLNFDGNVIKIENDSRDLFETKLKFPIGKNREIIELYWKRDNYLFYGFGRENKNNIYIYPPEIEYYYSRFRQNWYWFENNELSNEIYTVLSIDGGDVDEFVYYD